MFNNYLCVLSWCGGTVCQFLFWFMSQCDTLYFLFTFFSGLCSVSRPQQCPHSAACFVDSGPQLPIWHQNPINCIPMYILNRADECTISIVSSCTSSISLTSVYTYNLNTAAVSTSYEKCIICLESPPKNLISKCVFYWLKHGAASKPCVSASSSAGKKAQNWGFEITNVRYGHQPAFCRHFNDGSNSCFQTTNWNAAQAGYRQAFCKIVN